MKRNDRIAAFQQRTEKQSTVPCLHHSLILWGSFRGRQEEKWGSFRGWDHFGVDLGIISRSVSFRGLYSSLTRSLKNEVLENKRALLKSLSGTSYLLRKFHAYVLIKPVNVYIKTLKRYLLSDHKTLYLAVAEV